MALARLSTDVHNRMWDCITLHARCLRQLGKPTAYSLKCLSNAAEKLGERNPERSGYLLDVDKCEVAFAPLDAADISPVETAQIFKFFLRHS